MAYCVMVGRVQYGVLRVHRFQHLVWIGRGLLPFTWSAQ